MKIKQFMLISISMALVGCDTFHGPKLRNETEGVAELVVTYSTKETVSSAWPECSGTFLGVPGAKITQIIIRSGGDEIARIEESEIEKMIAKEEEVTGYHAWVIRDNEITFVTEQASDLCYQGKPLGNRGANDQAMLEALKNEIVIGASEEHVVRVLESLDMEFSFVTTESLMFFSMPRESDEYYKTLKGRYVSIIRDVERTVLSTKAISVQIDIGLDDRVKKVNIEPVYTAP